MLYRLYRIGRFLALALPLKFCYWVADIAGSCYYLLARKERRKAADNIKVVLNEPSDSARVRRASRMIFVGFARYLIEFFRAAKIDLEYIEKNIRIEGLSNLDQALKQGRGALLLSAHLGNWELGAMVLSMLGYKVNIVAWTHKNRLVNDFFIQQRQSKGINVIPLGTGIRKVFSALKNNQSVAVLGDIDYTDPESGITVKLFGRDTILPKGPAALSLKAACPVVPTFIPREKGNKFRFIFEQPIIYPATENHQQDLLGLTQQIARVLESYIARYPGQWFMLTARWQQSGREKKEG